MSLEKTVITLAPTIINGSSCKFTQMLGMIISRASSTQGIALKVKVTVAIP